MTIHLNQSYRCTQKILDASETVLYHRENSEVRCAVKERGRLARPRGAWSADMLFRPTRSRRRPEIL